MSIKILSGAAKGLTLAAPTSDTTRPTSVLLKRRVFDANQELGENIFIDLCAGIGTVGLEALSRGVKGLYLVEKNIKIYNVLLKNLKMVHQKVPETFAEAIKKDAMKWIEDNEQMLASLNNGILYLDPPYEELKIYTDVINKLKEVHYSGIIWAEACRQKTMHEDLFIQQFYSGRVYRQGTSYIVVGTINEN